MQKSLKKVIPIDRKKLQTILRNVGDMALKRRIEYIVTNLEVREGDKIFDCGCGEGFHLIILDEMFKKVELYGLDYDEKVLSKARETNKGKATIVQGDIYHLPFKDQFFDKIILSEVLEHLEEDHKALEEIARVLKKDGILIITVPNHNYPFWWDPVNKVFEATTGNHVRRGFFAGIWNMHLRLYTKEEIMCLVKSCNLKIDDISALTHYCLPFNHTVLYLMRRLLERHYLPQAITSTVDKFKFESRKKGAMDFVYGLLHSLDTLNDHLPVDKSSVALAFKVKK